MSYLWQIIAERACSSAGNSGTYDLPQRTRLAPVRGPFSSIADVHDPIHMCYRHVCTAQDVDPWMDSSTDDTSDADSLEPRNSNSPPGGALVRFCAGTFLLAE